jgi:hypothetical protein
MPKIVTTKEGITGLAIDLRKKTVEVIATEKSSHKTGSKRLVLASQVENLLKRGMIEPEKKK